MVRQTRLMRLRSACIARSFSTHLQQPLSVEILEGKFAAGDTILADVADDMQHLAFSKPADEDDQAAE